jgi:hypothetical protein
MDFTSFLPLIIIAGLVALGVVIYRRWSSARAATPIPLPGVPLSSGQPQGFGGWLIILAIGLTLAPFATAWEIAGSLDEANELSGKSREAALIVYAALAVLAAFLAFQVAVAIQMYRRSRHFPALLLWLWILGILLAIAGIGMRTLAESREAILADTQSLIEALRGVVWGGVWVLYVYKSVRVKNTFVR